MSLIIHSNARVNFEAFMNVYKIQIYVTCILLFDVNWSWIKFQTFTEFPPPNEDILKENSSIYASSSLCLSNDALTRKLINLSTSSQSSYH